MHKKASRVYLEENSVLRTSHKNLLKRIKLAQSGRIDNIAFDRPIHASYIPWIGIFSREDVSER